MKNPLDEGGDNFNARITLEVSPQDPLRIPLVVYALTPGGSSGDPQAILTSVTPA